MQYTRAEIYMKRFLSSSLYLLELFLGTYSLPAQQELIPFYQEWENLFTIDDLPKLEDLDTTTAREYYQIDRHYLYKIARLVLDLERYNQRVLTSSFVCPLCKTYTGATCKRLLEHIRNAHIPAYPF